MTMPTPPPPKSRSLLEQSAALLAAGMLLGFGTCGLGLWWGRDPALKWAVRMGADLFWLSLACLIILGLITAVRSILESFRK